MNFTYATPALLFPAISLLFISYTNRFISYANLIRSLHSTWKEEHNPLLEYQIRNLRQRMNMIKQMQTFGALALVACVACMVLLFFGKTLVSELLFALALMGMAVSIIILILEIRISMNALDIQIEDMQGNQNR